ncbi:hypothetical protein BsWGS_29131 [Bradybaena similaris]
MPSRVQVARYIYATPCDCNEVLLTWATVMLKTSNSEGAMVISAPSRGATMFLPFCDQTIKYWLGLD